MGDRGERGGGGKFDRKECTKDGKGNNSLSLFFLLLSRKNNSLDG